MACVDEADLVDIDPYDGGVDAFLATSEERDRFRDRQAIWLSSHPSGL
ncbi:hypothetical protein [Streptomyces sp. NPDC004783]